MSLFDPTNESAETVVPPVPRYSLTSSRGGLIPLVLQVSPLDNSSGQDEFFYDPFASVDSGDFVAARAFFINNGHVIIFHDCPDAMSFQELYPLATIGYISSLPVGFLAEGHRILAAQQALLRPSTNIPLPVQAPLAVTPPRSIVARYVAAGFSGPPSRSTTSRSSSAVSSSQRGYLRSRSPSRHESSSRGTSHATAIASRTVPMRVVPVGLHPLCPPDPDGDDFSKNHYGGPQSAHNGSFPSYGGPHLSSCPSRHHGGPPSRPHDIPPYIFHHVQYAPFPSSVPHATASVASSLGGTVAPRGSLFHAGFPVVADLDVSISLLQSAAPGLLHNHARYPFGPPPQLQRALLATPPFTGQPFPPPTHGGFAVPPPATPGGFPAPPPHIHGGVSHAHPSSSWGVSFGPPSSNSWRSTGGSSCSTASPYSSGPSSTSHCHSGRASQARPYEGCKSFSGLL